VSIETPTVRAGTDDERRSWLDIRRRRRVARFVSVIARVALAVALLFTAEDVIPVEVERKSPHRGTWRAFLVVGRSGGIPLTRQIDLEILAPFGRIRRSILWVAGNAWVQKDSFIWMPGTHGRHIGAKEFGIPVRDLKEVSVTGVSRRWTGVVLRGQDGWEAWLLFRESYAVLIDALARHVAQAGPSDTAQTRSPDQGTRAPY
jgi:hypothetical protein